LFVSTEIDKQRNIEVNRGSIIKWTLRRFVVSTIIILPVFAFSLIS